MRDIGARLSCPSAPIVLWCMLVSFRAAFLLATRRLSRVVIADGWPEWSRAAGNGFALERHPRAAVRIPAFAQVICGQGTMKSHTYSPAQRVASAGTGRFIDRDLRRRLRRAAIRSEIDARHEHAHMSSNENHHDGSPHDSRTAEVLDMRILNDLRELGGEDDPALITELIGIFLSDAPLRLQEISRGLSRGDLAIVERAAHTLKSSSANIGAIGLSRLCREMEELARERKLEPIPSIFARSQHVMSTVQSALEGLKP
jgi:HPt (histidine-containing phosphotransfer) domain-containing protein